MKLTRRPSDSEILSALEAWIDQLAEGEFGHALSGIRVEPDMAWSPQALEAVIAGYGLPEAHPSGKRFRVTPRSEARGGPPRVAIDRVTVPPDALAYAEHDLPLNGSWSDLTACFVIRATHTGSELVLQDVHVL